MAVISRQQNELIEAERAKTEAPGSGQGRSEAQEARGMRHGAPPRSANAPAGKAPQRSSPMPRGSRKGTAMDALAIFGAMAGGS